MRRIMFFSIITFFILMTSCSLEEWKLQNIEVDRVKRLVSDLNTLKTNLSRVMSSTSDLYVIQLNLIL